VGALENAEIGSRNEHLSRIVSCGRRADFVGRPSPSKELTCDGLGPRAPLRAARRAKDSKNPPANRRGVSFTRSLRVPWRVVRPFLCGGSGRHRAIFERRGEPGEQRENEILVNPPRIPHRRLFEIDHPSDDAGERGRGCLE
jgi:hypothetical protein